MKKIFIILLGACALLSTTACTPRYSKNLTVETVTDVGANPQGRYIVRLKSTDELGRTYDTFECRTDEKFEAGDRPKIVRQ